MDASLPYWAEMISDWSLYHLRPPRKLSASKSLTSSSERSSSGRSGQRGWSSPTKAAHWRKKKKTTRINQTKITFFLIWKSDTGLFVQNQIWTGVKCLLKNYSWVLNKGNPDVWITHKELNLWASHLNDKLSSKLLLSWDTRLHLLLSDEFRSSGNPDTLTLGLDPTHSTPCPPTITPHHPRAPRSLLASEPLNAACWHFVIHQPLLCNLANVCCVWQLPLLSQHTHIIIMSALAASEELWDENKLGIWWREKAF